jgi:nitrite reductase/ring-hydroxylating ferredoxin subunit
MDDSAPRSEWVRACSRQELEQAGRTLFRAGPKQIVLFATPKGVRACNNRCPHEGYPLSEGTLDAECRLTCNWHNWKFDLEDGANLYGGDRLRTYPVALRGEDYWVDVADAPAALRQREALEHLRDAFADKEYDRIARDLVRLRRAGGALSDALAAAILWSHDRLEFGWTHAYAGAADWLALADEAGPDPERPLIAILEAMTYIAEDVLREPVFGYGEDVADYDEAAFLAAIEAQDEGRAMALVRGGFERGLGFADLEPALSRAALAHYIDFGHPLIYVVKCGRLIARLGAAVEKPLTLALVRGIAYAAREDLIPEFRGYAKALARFGKAPAKSLDDEALRRAGIGLALELVAAAGAAPPLDLYRSMLAAGAERLLTFDLGFDSRHDGPVADNASWLDVTHGITFANAVRRQGTKFPDLWPAGLLQLACHAGRNLGFTDRTQDLSRWAVKDADRFFEEEIAALFDHGIEEEIVAVHRLKTLLAAREEWRAGAAGKDGPLLLAAVHRYLHEPLKGRHPRRTARQAMAFVAREG